MNTGQSLLTIGAMILLSVLILRINNTFLTTGTVLMESKFAVLATSIATSQLEEISNKAFDNYTASNPTKYTGDLTPYNRLGPETGETPATYNDVDDYNGYTKTDSTMPSAIFKINCKVEYVNTSNPDVAVNTQTWNKKITVYVTSVSMKDTVKMSEIYSYWVFR